MKTRAIRWIIVLIAILNFGFMALDGMRALTMGDYIRPESGEYAGQLGPWAHLVESISIDPESTLMKIIFVSWGAIGLFLTLRFARNKQNSVKHLLSANILSLWYLVFGTLSSVVQIILLIIIRKKT